MLIATATLITILLLGAQTEFYYIHSLENGVKKEVVDKSTRKQINGLLSQYKKEVKAYDKARTSYMKQLDKMVTSQFTSDESFQAWSQELISLTTATPIKCLAV